MAAPNSKDLLYARQARLKLAEQAAACMPSLCLALSSRLGLLLDQSSTAREMQEHRDALMLFQKCEGKWLRSTVAAWNEAASPAAGAPVAPQSLSDNTTLELVANDVVENTILASRLALSMLEKASSEYNDLRLRVRTLEGLADLAPRDIIRPESLAKAMVQQWNKASLTGGIWLLTQDVIHQHMAVHVAAAYRNTNALLVKLGVMVEINLQPLVRKTNAGNIPVAADKAVAGEALASPSSPGFSDSIPARTGDGARAAAGSGGEESGQAQGRNPGGSNPGAFFPGARSLSDAGASRLQSPHTVSAQEETRLETRMPPLLKARMRAQGMVGQLRRLISPGSAVGAEHQGTQPASPQLTRALEVAQSAARSEGRKLASQGAQRIYDQSDVEQAASSLRQRTNDLKREAGTPSEKAIIEIVALMFQHILAEERIPASVRVWFARLQMPVLRVAVGEPEFFASLDHPARRLIDRMGSCVLGFNVNVGGTALEAEIKRVVQVIEQYPETGRRVFQLVHDEFQRFLARFLSEHDKVAKVTTVAQQVEQKETMVIQYTIEMRSMLNDMPVRATLQDFLFKVWAEVIAIAAMQNGPQHATAIAFKRAAADLVWASSAKPSREERARVIADLSRLFQVLRSGMALLGLSQAEQDRQIKLISDTLAEAFMSRTGAISAERIEALAARLAHLEDYLAEESVGDLPMQARSVELMIGIEDANMQVITDGGSTPGEAIRAWVKELEIGSWFSLDHNGQVSHVQFVWLSERKQLHLFAAADGRKFLLQAGRLAAYLQAGLLVPTEEETLTVRATRDALAKIQANPERLN
ncbi:MAG: DUF1631 family protein [Pseudomonadota bacterium]